MKFEKATFDNVNLYDSVVKQGFFWIVVEKTKTHIRLKKILSDRYEIRQRDKELKYTIKQFNAIGYRKSVVSPVIVSYEEVN